MAAKREAMLNITKGDKNPEKVDVRVVRLIPVESSNIKSLGYDRKSKELSVMFSTNAYYKYKNVPSDLFLDMLQAASIGKFFNEFIKKYPEKYPFTKSLPTDKSSVAFL